MVFSELITNILTIRNINARQLGEAIGVTGQTISNLKTGRVLKPDAKTCEALLSYCKSYGIDTSELNWNDVIRGYFLKSKYASDYEWISDVDEHANICLRHKKCRRITTVPIMSLDGVSTPCIYCWTRSYMAQDAYSIKINSYTTEFPIRHNRCGHTYNVFYEQIKQKKYFCPVCYGNRLGESDETSYGARQDYRFISDPERITPYKSPVQPYEELVAEIEDDTPLSELSFEDFLDALDGKTRKKTKAEQDNEEDDDKPTTDALVSYVKEATKDLELYWLDNDLIECISKDFALNTYNANTFIKEELSPQNILSSKVYFACFDPDHCKKKVAAICDGFTFENDRIDQFTLLVFTAITTLDGIVHNSLSTLALVDDEEVSQQTVAGLFFYSGEGEVDPIYAAIHKGINAYKRLPDVDVRDITAVERDICEHKTTVSFFLFFRSLLLKCDDEVIAELLPKVDKILNHTNDFLATRELNKLAIEAEILIKRIEADQRKVDEERRLADERRKAEEARRCEEARRKAEEEARRKAEEEARRKAEEEARRKAEEEARRKAEEEARRKAEEEARRKAEEEARRKAEEEARRKAREEAQRKTEEKKRLAEERKRIDEANADGLAKGMVIDAKLEGLSPVATLIVQHGTLREGDKIVIGTVEGRVRTIIDYKKGFVKVAKAVTRVKIAGLTGVPNLGDTFEVVTDVNKTRKLAESCQKPNDEKSAQKSLASTMATNTLESAKQDIGFPDHSLYFAWLSSKISIDFLDDLIMAYGLIQRFAMASKLLKKPLLETTDIVLLRKIQAAVRTRSEFASTRYFAGLAMRHYLQYVSEIEEEHRLADERRKAEEARRRQEARRKAEEEARRKAEEERRLAEIRKKAEETRRQEEYRRKVEDEARRKAEAEIRLVELHERVEEARRQEKIKRKAKEEARQCAEQIRLLITVCKQIAVVKQQEETRRKAEEARRQEEEVRRKAEEERRLAEELKIAEASKRQHEARRRAEEEARQKDEEDQRQREEERVRYRKSKRCQHCGGEFKAFLGIFGKRCKICNRPKDYTA